MRRIWTTIRTSNAFHWILDPKNSRYLVLGLFLIGCAIAWKIVQMDMSVPSSTPAKTPVTSFANLNDEQARLEILKLEWAKDVFISPGHMNVGVIRSEKRWDSPMIGTTICGIMKQKASELNYVRFVDIEEVTDQRKSITEALIHLHYCQ